MKLRDLIEVPPIRTVIQLADSERGELHAELLDGFVFTHDIEALFTRLLHALAQPHGLGCFLKGHYGSGKSHCLAFLDQLLQGNPRAEKRLPPPLKRFEAEWVVVRIPLFAFGSQHNLESIVFQAIQDQLPGAPWLADSSRLLENFKTYVVPVYPERLAGFHGLAPEAALKRAREFLKELPENPLQLHYDRRQAMNALSRALGQRRLVVLLDELSEYLRSQDPHGPGHREDVRFLQFLGEWAGKLPLWIVATLQHSLEELGYGEDASALRIRERFPLRFTLSSRHVADLIAGRLIRHRSEEPVRQQWRALERVYPGLIRESEFLRTYPVHPRTLELLESLTPLFSRQRGVVDFVHTQLAGDPLRGVRGMLDEPADRLLTPESLFDHFRDRFSDQAELAPYESSCWAYYERELPALFPQPKERELAAAVVKLLILAAISPVPIETNADQLTLMLARQISLLDPKTNSALLHEKVLEVLVQRGAYVVRRGSNYVLDLQANLNQILGQRLREALHKIRPDWAAAARLVNRPELPLTDLVGRAPVPFKVRWRNTHRDGLWTWSDQTGWLTQLDTDRYDCGLLLLPPGVPPPRFPQLPNLVIWQPAEVESEVAELNRQWQAHRKVMDQDAELRPRLQSLTAQLEQRLEQATYSLYARGRLFWGEDQGLPPLHEVQLPRLLAATLAAPLELRFPRFASIAPRLDGLTSKHLNQLWNEFIEPGQGPVSELVTALLEPLRLVQEGKLSLLPGGPAAEMLAAWQPEQRYNLRTLAHQWQKSPWGLVAPQFHLVLACLVQLGKLQLYSHGRAFTLTSIDELLRGKADEFEVHALKVLPRLEELERLQWMFGEVSPVPLSPGRLRDLWRAARGKLEELRQQVTLLRQELSKGILPDLPEIENGLLEAIERVGLPHSSVQGLQNLISENFGRFRELAAELPTWLHFLRHQATELSQLRRKLVLLEQPQLAEGIDMRRPWQGLTALREEVQAFQSGRSQLYREKHDSYYRATPFGLRRQLQRSPEWLALEALDRVLGFQSQPTAASLRLRLQALPTPCRRNVEEQLLLALTCSCGYREDQPLPPAEDLLPEVREALVSGARQLLSQPVDTYLRNLRSLGQERAASRLERCLEQLDQLAAGQFGSCLELVDLLDAPTQQHLSQALTGQTLVVTRDLQSLVNQLQDRRLPVAELRRLFDGWLQGPDLRHDAWVHLTAPGTGDSAGPGGWLARWLAQHDLQPSPALRRRYNLQAEPQGEPPVDELWPVLLDLSEVLEPARAATREVLFEKLSEHFCRRALAEAPPGWGQQLPTLDWPHLQTYRQLTRALAAGTFPDYARGWREWQRLAYEHDLPEWIGERLESRPVLPEASVALAEAPALLLHDCPQPWILLVLDGLRWDLWDLLRTGWEQRLGVPQRELLVRSAFPSTTQNARLAWLGGPEPIPDGADGLLLGRPLRLIKNADDKRHLKTVLAALKEGPPALMLHLNFIDRRRHESSLELWPLYRELLLEAEVRLRPILDALPPGRALALLSDHGFRDPGPHPAHGGDHWQELYVPAVLWRL